MGIIYQARNKINGRCYVGKTINSLEDRKQNHEDDSLKGSRLVFHRALRKYGFGVFEWKVLVEKDDESKLNDSEIMLIGLLKTKVPNGYNMTDGGNGGPLFLGKNHSEKSKEKMRGPKSLEHRKNMSKGCMGRVISIEQRQNHSKMMKGRKPSLKARIGASNANTGRKFSKETRKKLSEAQKVVMRSPSARFQCGNANRGRSFSIEYRAKISAGLKAFYKNKRNNQN